MGNVAEKDGKTCLYFYGGLDHIGGNKICAMASNGKGVLLDWGYDFYINKQYFDEFLRPRKSEILVDMIKIGALPWPLKPLSNIYREDLMRKLQRRIHMMYQDSNFSNHHSAPLEMYPNVHPNITHVLLSHAHSDHSGQINLLHTDIKVAASETTNSMLNILDEVSAGSSVFHGLTSYKLKYKYKRDKHPNPFKSNRKKSEEGERDFINLDNGQEINVAHGGFKVKFFLTDHSVPGAGAFLLEDVKNGKRIAYTGDIRKHGPLNGQALQFIENAKRFQPDALIVEGTRVGETRNDRDENLGSEKNVEKNILKFIHNIPDSDSDKIIFFNCSQNDLWRIATFYRVACETGRILVINARIFNVLCELQGQGLDFGVDLSQIKVYLPRKGWGMYKPKDYAYSQDLKMAFSYSEEEFEEKWEECKAEGISMGSKAKYMRINIEKSYGVNADQVHANQGQYLFYLPDHMIKELFDLHPKKESYYILSKSGPFDDEGLLEEKRRHNWFKLFSIPLDSQHHGHFHCSGHMPMKDLFKMIDMISPKKIFPVHTEHPEIFKEEFNHKYEVIIPEKYRSYEI